MYLINSGRSLSGNWSDISLMWSYIRIAPISHRSGPHGSFFIRPIALQLWSQLQLSIVPPDQQTICTSDYFASEVEPLPDILFAAADAKLSTAPTTFFTVSTVDASAPAMSQSKRWETVKRVQPLLQMQSRLRFIVDYSKREILSVGKSWFHFLQLKLLGQISNLCINYFWVA